MKLLAEKVDSRVNFEFLKTAASRRCCAKLSSPLSFIFFVIWYFYILNLIKLVLIQLA